MHVINILYPVGDDTTFDMDYYTSTHMPMFAEACGEAMSGWGAATAMGDDYHCFAWATITDMDAYQAAMKEHGGKIIGDVPNYTNSQPIMITGAVAGMSDS